ncbi:MAG: PRD domain-containing protein [Dorea sp.]|nr:PRD domain-containing protein [Dorea sp.]
MYRIKKVLNHNTVIAIRQDDNQECLIMGKGIGFGKKTSERIDTRSEDRVYSMKEYTERGSAKEIIKSVPPEFLEITNEVLNEAEKIFGKIDRNVLFPLADHIAFAVQRIQNHEQISNPLTEDIRVLFYMEFKAAEKIRPLLEQRMGIQIDDDEVGYVALHIHSAIEDEKVSQAMQMARAVRECISLVEQTVGKPIDVASLSYNRLMNHIRYMVARAMSGEKLKVNMNDYMKIKFPEAFQMAESVCTQVGHSLGCKLEDVEVGYLAMHIERVASDELDTGKED